jgi:hypothetical protein
VSGFQEPGFRVIRNWQTENFKDSQTNSDIPSTLTRARDLNPIINFLTKTPALRGLRPLPPQTHPTRHTPIRIAYGNPTTTHYRAALSGGKKDAYQCDPRVLTAKVTLAQLEAMDCDRFDIGVKRSEATMQLREGWGAKQVLKAILWLRHENLYGAHIYVRPAGIHGLSLVDDLTADAISRMKAEGYEPAVVVETSPGNFQAWLKHGQGLDEAAGTYAAKELARRFGGDPPAPTGGISEGSRGSPTRSPAGGCNPECSRLRGSTKPPGGSIARPRTFSGQCARKWSRPPANFKPRKGMASRIGGSGH